MRWRAAVFCLFTSAAFSSENAWADDDHKGVYLEMPLADAQLAGTVGHAMPTMQQSMWLTTDLAFAAHFGLSRIFDPFDRVWWKALIGRGMTVGADLLFVLGNTPGASSWEHEEFHRAVMSNAGVPSFDETWTFPLFAGSVSVSHESDESLAQFKKNDPAGFVRMQTAGIEGAYELATNIEKTQFFYRPKSWNPVLVSMLYLSNTFYMLTCASEGVDGRIAEQEQSEGTDIAKRDFTGPDCTGWTYDLHRPKEPWEQRGIHPSGVGVRRYRRWADLNDTERDYLSTQSILSLINFVDPIILGFFDSVRIGKTRWMANVRHMPTSFGSTVDLQVFFNTGDVNLFGRVQNGLNKSGYFPGLELELHRFPLKDSLWLGAKAGVWFQPQAQRFDTTTVQPGMMGSLRLGMELTKAVAPFVELEMKSAGWVAGNPVLGSAFAARTGLTIWIH